MKHLLFILCLPLLAQTTVKPDQLRPAAPEAPRPVLLAFSLKGFTPVTLGPGISVTLTPTGYVIDAAATKWTLSVAQTVLALSPDGSVPLAPNATLKRNGLHMTPGIDYTYSNGKATPKTPWAADDLLVAVSYTLDPG